jgi:hypothetical protein
MASGYDGEREERELEWKLRAIAVPAALALALGFHAFGTGRFLQQTFLGMMVHECGHAVTAWLCGMKAMPFLWKTMIAPDRTLIVTALVALLLIALTWRWWIAERRGLAAAGAGVLALQLYLTFAISLPDARELITFGGDGGAMVIGAALMATFFADRESQLVKGWLRWGFIVIGAGAFVGTFATWWSARTDVRAIPFGEIEGVGLSDPTKLRTAGWSNDLIVDRYVSLGVACLVVLAGVYAWGVWTARRDARTDPGS